MTVIANFKGFAIRLIQWPEKFYSMNHGGFYGVSSAYIYPDEAAAKKAMENMRAGACEIVEIEASWSVKEPEPKTCGISFPTPITCKNFVANASTYQGTDYVCKVCGRKYFDMN